MRVENAEQDRMSAAIRERLAEVRGRDLTNAEVDAAAQQLVAMGEPAVSILLEQFMDEDETLLAVATQTLKAWPEPRPVEPLIRLLRNPEVSDLAKALVLNILERYGLDVDDPEVFGLAIDLEEYQVDSSDNGQNGETN